MLGFSQYSQVSYVAIIEQKIRLFFLSAFTVSPRLANFVKSSFNSSGTLESSVINSLFSAFVQSLKDKNLYEEYLIPSVFIEEINYDFITNENSKTLQIAEKNFKDTFFRVLKETLNVTEAQATEQDTSPSDAFLTKLLSLGKIREVPSYAKNGLFLLPEGNFITSLFKIDDKVDKNVFYLETFYRIKDEAATNLTKEEIKKAQFMSAVEAEQFNSKKLSGPLNENFVKGIRLMMNLTSASLMMQGSSMDPTNLPGYIKQSLKISLPFLNSAFKIKLENIVDFAGSGNYFKLPKGGYKNTYDPGAASPSKVKKVPVDEKQVRVGIATALNSDIDDSFKDSKAFVSVEEALSSFYVYFPISMSEFISQDFNATNVELANGLSTTTTFNEVFASAYTTGEVTQIIITLLRFFSINPIEFFEAANNSSIKSQNEALDNMIINLINFDEV
jgi:hypothetical protein